MTEESLVKGNKIQKEIELLNQEKERAENLINEFRSGDYYKMSYENLVRIRAIVGKVYADQIEHLETDLKNL